LMIYMHQLHETEAAEAYCDRIYKYSPDSHTLSLFPSLTTLTYSPS
jgi:hypothetical protein